MMTRQPYHLYFKTFLATYREGLILFDDKLCAIGIYIDNAVCTSVLQDLSGQLLIANVTRSVF